MAFGKINFEHDGLYEGLNPLEKIAAMMTLKGIIKIEAQCVPRGVATCVGINKNFLALITPGEQIEIEMALDALVKALDGPFTENEPVIDWLLQTNEQEMGGPKE